MHAFVNISSHQNIVLYTVFQLFKERVYILLLIDRQFSADSQALADQIDDVFITQHSSVSVGEEIVDNDGVTASRSEARLSTEDPSVDG